MAAWTYATFKQTLTNWLVNDDISDAIDEIIEMAEDRMSRRLANHLQSETLEDTATDTDEIALPADFIQPIVFYLPTSPKKVLTYVPPEMLRASEGNFDTGDETAFYTIEGDKIIILPAAPAAGLDYVLKYFKRLPDIATNNTNWVLQRHRDVYLYGALTEAMVYLMDDARKATYEAIFGQRVGEINRLTPRAKHKTTAQTTQRMGGAKVV